MRTATWKPSSAWTRKHGRLHITFHHKDASTPEEQWFNDAHSAWEAFRLFAEPDLRNQALLEHIHSLARSKFAIMDASDYIATVGEFIDDHGLLFSNDSYCERRLWLPN